MSPEIIASVLVLVFILLDFISGIMKAWVTKTLSSTTLREGLMHKASFIMVLLLGWLCQIATPYLQLPEAFATVYYVAAAYICITEICSIIENLGEVNPELTSSGIFKLFDVSNKGDSHE